MEIYLIRHTTPAVEQGVCYGQTDLDLVPDYLDEFQLISEKLPETFDAIYSSPLKRCLQLARHITKEVVIDDRLMEYNFGEWEMLKWEDIPKTFLNDWMKDFVNSPAPSGESMKAMQSRVMSFFTDLMQGAHQSVAVVTHSVVIRIVLCWIENKPLHQAFDIQLEYGDIRKIVIDKNMLKSGNG